MADIQSVSQVVHSNTHPVTVATTSVVDMFRSMNLQAKNPETQILPAAEPGVPHEFATINGSTGNFIQAARPTNNQIQDAMASETMDGAPDKAGLPGATDKIKDPPLYEMFAENEERIAAERSFNQTAVMAAVGGVTAVAIYFFMNTPKKRYS